MIQLTLTLKMTTAQVVETSVTVNNNSPIQDYVHPDDQTQPTFAWLCCCHMMSWRPYILMYQNNERWPCWGPLCLWDRSLFFCKKFLSFLRNLLILYLLATTNLSCILDKSQVQCEPMHGTLHYTAFSFWLMCLVLCPEHSCLTKLEINPLSPNGDQHQFSPNNIHRLSRD